MSSSPLWLLSLISDEAAGECRPRFDEAIGAVARHPAVVGGLRVWSEAGDLRDHLICHMWENGVGEDFPAWPPRPETEAIWVPPRYRSRSIETDEVAQPIFALFWSAELPWSDANFFFGRLEEPADDLDHEVWVTRKLCPAAVLLTGLGWERVQRLPGLAGNYLLGADEVRAGLPEIEAVFALSRDEREAVLSRMGLWEETGDAGAAIDLDRMLDAIPRLHRRAAERGAGILSCASTP
jgi:hypothetical protein